MIEKKILADFSDGTSYVRPFVIFRDCIQKVVQFTEPAVINYGNGDFCFSFRVSTNWYHQKSAFAFWRTSTILWMLNVQSSIHLWFWIHRFATTSLIRRAIEPMCAVWISSAKFPAFNSCTLNAQRSGVKYLYKRQFTKEAMKIKLNLGR